MDHTYEEIYYDVFSNLKKAYADIFLCGGASSKKETSYRDLLREELKKRKRLSILYPEDLFVELLNRKKYDLLTLERFLALNCDYIIIVCESPGSFAELGAFVNNNETLDKVIVLLQTKYKNAKSFIRQGPTQFVLSKNKNHVIFYNKKILEVADQIYKLVIPKYSKRDVGISFKDLNTISGQYYFILFLLFFYSNYETNKLIEAIKSLYSSRGFPLNEFDLLYKAAIKRLFKEGLLKKSTLNSEANYYLLTEKGYQTTYDLLSYVDIIHRTKVFDNIRLKIMNNKQKD